MRSFFPELIKGLLIGAGAILPGISGASLAVVFGVYEDFMLLVSHPLKTAKPFFVRHYPLCIGIAAGFGGFTLLLGRLFGSHNAAVIFLFMGFIAGTLPGIFGTAGKNGIGKAEILSFAIAVLFFLGLAFFTRLGYASFPRAETAGDAYGAVTALPARAWVAAGAVIGAGSLMPGISASFILIYLGMYGPLLDALRERSLIPLLLVGAGIAASVILLSRLIDRLYGRWHGPVYFAVLGCTLGSLMLVFSALDAGTEWLLNGTLLASGFAASFFLERSA